MQQQLPQAVRRALRYFGLIKQSHKYRKLLPYMPLTILILGFGLCGLILTVASHAATYSKPQEAEAGQLNGNANTVADTTGKASGGSFVTFSSGGNPGPTPNPTPPPSGGGSDRYSFDNAPTLDTCNSFGKTAPLSGYTLDKCDDFSGSSLAGGWGPYEGGGSDTVCDGADGPGHSRDPSHIAVHDGMVTMTQDSDGKTGAMSNDDFGGQYGYWEVREKDYTTGSGGQATHPVLIIWPNDDAGELDYMETDAGNSEVEVFLHDLGGGNAYNEKVNVDKTKWHVWGFQWTSSDFTGFLDGQQWFSYSGQDAQMGPGSATIQLDNLNGCPATPSKMDVDWMHVYRKGGASAPTSSVVRKSTNPSRHTLH
jgi:hypothetical protein